MAARFLWAAVAAFFVSLCYAQDPEKLNIILAVDKSGSICSNDGCCCDNMNSVIDFCKKIIQALLSNSDWDAEMAFISFADFSTIDQYFTTTSSLLETAADNLQSYGRTATKMAIEEAMDVFDSADKDRSNATKAIILVTDGKPNNGSGESEAYVDATIVAADEAIADDVNIIVVGVPGGADFNESLVQRLSSPPRIKDQNYFIADNFDLLTEEDLINSILSNVPETTTTTTTTTTTPTTTTTTPTTTTTTTPTTTTTTTGTTTTQRTTTREPAPQTGDDDDDNEFFEWLRDEPVWFALIGMGVMILILVVIIVILLCTRNKKG